MTTVTAACPATTAPTGSASASAGPQADGDGFAEMMSGMDPRRAATGSASDERRPTSFDEAAARDVPAPDVDADPRSAVVLSTVPAPKPARRSAAEAGETAVEPTPKRAADVPDTTPLGDALMMVTPEKKPARDAEPADDRSDRQSTAAPVATATFGAAAIALGRLLTEHRLAAAEVGRRGGAESLRGGSVGDATTAKAAVATGADTGTTTGPDPFAGIEADGLALAVSETAAPKAEPAAAPRVDVEVLDRATWLPPVVTQDNLRQIADAVVTAAAHPAASAPSSSAPAATALASDLQTGLQSHGVVRTLTIRLQPDDLGTLTASFRIDGDTMTLHLVASRPETAQQLAADKDRLARVLEKAGVSAGHLVVSVADPIATANGQATGSGAESQGQAGGQSAGQPGGQAFGQPSGQGFTQGEGRGSAGERRPDHPPSDRAWAESRNDPPSSTEARAPQGRGGRCGDLYL